MQIKNVLNSRALEWHRTSDAVGQQCRQFLTYRASLLVKKRRVWTSHHRCSSACLSSLAEKFSFCFIVIVRNKEEKSKTQNKKRCPVFFSGCLFRSTLNTFHFPRSIYYYHYPLSALSPSSFTSAFFITIQANKKKVMKLKPNDTN